MVQKNNEQDKLGADLIVTEAELKDMQHPINRNGDTRQGGDSLGKRIGMKVLVDMGPNTTELGGDALGFNNYKYAMALGPNPADPYQDLTDAAVLIVPTNILDPDNTDASWTETTATYVDGLLDATGAAAVNATQDVALAAGTYILEGTANRENALRAVKLVVTGSAEGIVLTKTYSTVVVSADDSEGTAISDTFTLAVAQTVTFDLNIVTIAGGADAIGKGRLRFILQAD